MTAVDGAFGIERPVEQRFAVDEADAPIASRQRARIGVLNHEARVPVAAAGIAAEVRL